MQRFKKILIADDHELIRKGLLQSISSFLYTEIIETRNGKDALEKCIEFNPDLVILDIEMPFFSGYDVAKQLKSLRMDMKIIFLTMHKDEIMFNKALDLGVNGYVLKENTISEIEACMQSVAQGNYYISPDIANLLVKRNMNSVSLSESNLQIALTSTEKNVIALLAQMKTSQEIADELGVSLKTVKNHRNNICSKLNLSGAHALLKYAIEYEKSL